MRHMSWVYSTRLPQLQVLPRHGKVRWPRKTKANMCEACLPKHGESIVYANTVEPHYYSHLWTNHFWLLYIVAALRKYKCTESHPCDLN